jgi:uncharacterized protein (DUF2147 family)
MMTRLIAAAIGVMLAIPALAADMSSPIGLWKTIDDKTGQPKALVRIYDQGGRLFGKIEKGFDPNARPTCVTCTDERKDQPMLGLALIRNMVRDGDGWSGGDILDPATGSVYRCSFHLEQNGTRLAVRGYAGMAMFGRTQTWERQP